MHIGFIWFIYYNLIIMIHYIINNYCFLRVIINHFIYLTTSLCFMEDVGVWRSTKTCAPSKGKIFKKGRHA